MQSAVTKWKNAWHWLCLMLPFISNDNEKNNNEIYEIKQK